jgi:hypothetical protein
LPFGGTTPAGAVLLYSLDYLPGSGGVAEGDQDLVEHYVIQNFTAALLKFEREAPGEVTSALDEVA